MRLLNRLLAAICLITAVLGAPAVQAADLAVEDKAKQIWQLLDYLAVDYSAAVADGKVTDQTEYAEMQEFAQVAERHLGELPGSAGKAGLLAQAAALKAAIEGKAAPAEIGERARSLNAALVASYPVPMAPRKAPDLEKGQALYQAQCASCHGAQGKGDGPLAAQLNPPPVAFSDRERARERSLFALHQTITRGVEGTSMPAFGALSDEDRWSLSLYASTLAYSDEERAAGAGLWKSDPALRAAVPSLDALGQLSESALAKTVPAQQAGAVLAYLRSHPEALGQSAGGALALSRNRLRESLTALEAGDRAGATRLALSAYLDGFEPVEPALAIRDKTLFAEIEKSMGQFRGAISAGNAGQARETEAALQARLLTAQDTLAETRDDPMGIFVGALTILLREGLEALLVIVAMIAFLKKADRRDVLPVVHAGWIAALAAGGLTWFAATYLIEVSGASREMTEGFSAIFAAVVLLSVGIWMHQKSLAGRWQIYIREKMSGALSRRSSVMLFLLAFVTVYREVFETVLFYAALWTEGTGAYLMAGFALGIVLLAVLAYVMLRTSALMPIAKFFAISSALVAVLAVILIGKGVAALQEAGMLAITPIQGPSVDLLGVYPSLQSVAAQVIVALVVIVTMALNSCSTTRKRA